MLLNGKDLHPSQVAAIASGEITHLQVDPAALSKLRQSYRSYEKKAESQKIYGRNTALGAKRDLLLTEDNADTHSTIQATATSSSLFGNLAPGISKAMLAVQINSFLAGGVPIRAELVEKLVDVFNGHDLENIPSIPAIGNGAADLNSAALFAKWWLDEDKNFHLEPGEDLALISGNHYSDTLSSILATQIERLMDAVYLTFAVSSEAFRAQTDAIDDSIAKARPIPELANAIRHTRTYLEGSRLLKEKGRSLQDPTSFRSFPQVAATVEHQLAELVDYLNVEINASTQNPLYVYDDDKVIHNANFDTTQHSITLSGLNLALAKLADTSFKRLTKLCDPHFNGASDGFELKVSPKSGVQSHNLTNMAGHALSIITQCAQTNITSGFMLNFQNSIEDSVSNVFQQSIEMSKLLTNLHILVTCELVTGIAGVKYRLANFEISKDDLSPAVANIYEALSKEVPSNGGALNIDTVFSRLGDTDLVPSRKHGKFVRDMEQQSLNHSDRLPER